MDTFELTKLYSMVAAVWLHLCLRGTQTNVTESPGSFVLASVIVLLEYSVYYSEVPYRITEGQL